MLPVTINFVHRRWKLDVFIINGEEDEKDDRASPRSDKKYLTVIHLVPMASLREQKFLYQVW